MSSTQQTDLASRDVFVLELQPEEGAEGDFLVEWQGAHALRNVGAQDVFEHLHHDAKLPFLGRLGGEFHGPLANILER